MAYKQPVSVLVLVYTRDRTVLLLERADFPEHWQSVTGSQEPGEPLVATASRELLEETGIDALPFGTLTDWSLSNVYEIYPKWRHRYQPGVTHNTEHVFGLRVPDGTVVTVNPREHLQHCWLPHREAAEKCFSWSNRAAIDALEQRVPASRTFS